MSKLVSMEKKEQGMAMAMTESKYPYGLEIRLDEQSLQALSVKELPKIGEYFMILAKAEVVSVSSIEHKGGEESRHVCLQICEMAPPQKAKEEKKTEEVMYG